jgi:hypothetical protein
VRGGRGRLDHQIFRTSCQEHAPPLGASCSERLPLRSRALVSCRRSDLRSGDSLEPDAAYTFRSTQTFHSRVTV